MAIDEAEERSSVATRAPEQRRDGWDALRILGQREFALFWFGQTISMVGTWMQNFAQGWVVTGLTTSAFALGLVNFASSIPTLILMPFGGVLADRMERRQILIWTQWVMLGLALVMGWLVASHQLQLWHVFAVALLLGIVTAYDMPAFQSFYPQLVERDDLPLAISLNGTSFHGSRIIGPAIAGPMIAAWGTAAAFFANAVSFLAVILGLSLIRPRPPSAGAGHSSPWQSMREGFRYVRERPSVQMLLLNSALGTLFIFPNLAVLLPYYAQHILKVGTPGLGAMMTASGLGAFLGSVLLLATPVEQRFARLTLASLTIVGTISVMAWAHDLALVVGVIALQSLAISTSMGLSSIMVQELVPDGLRGRVMSLQSLTFMGVMPFSSLLVTKVVDLIGMRVELQAAGLLFALTICWMLLRLRRALMELS